MTTYLGIDIGAASVKVAVVLTAYRKTSLGGFGSVELTPGANVAAAIQAAVLQALGKPGTGDGIAAAIDGEKATVRTLTLPASAQRQLAEILPFELEAQMPFDVTESVFDYRVLKVTGPTVEGEAPTLAVLAGVARIDDVRGRIALVKEALGAEPDRVGLGGFPLANLVPHTPMLLEAASGDRVAVVVDLGVNTSDVLILRGGEPVFARTISQGTLGLPQSAPRLAREIRVTLAAFRAQGGTAAGHVFLCGGGAFVSGAESFLSGELETPVTVLPAPSIEAEPPALERVHEMPRFARAIGLALGLGPRPLGLDLRRGPLVFERGFGWVREKVPVLVGLGAVMMVMFIFSSCAQLYAASKEKEALSTALGMVTKDVLGEETTDPARATELLAAQTGSEEDPMPHADGFDVMVKLSEHIPQSMTHDVEDLDVQKGHVIIHGLVGTIPDAQSIATSLRNEKCFDAVKITGTNQAVGSDRQKYTLELDIKCPEDQKGGKKDAGAPPAASASAGGK